MTPLGISLLQYIPLCLHSIRELHPLPSVGLLLPPLLEPDRLYTDEATRVAWRKACNLVHTALVHVVQGLSRRGATEDGDGTLVGTASYAAVDVGLRGFDGGFEAVEMI